eukprot:CAMPEP_0204333908 /NCGR_PEP_ID=MMETSP0469-20131031/17601_1 /ASSEMBLY_ACC=CAM_ASM_000384 /TAXON_ID=2969 /ORGANISM="Oxyrrhis marina" /LENGTH=139 /DNA_ID=CAMNT_0051317333 /DNA_START=30 /DNA_END=447 /DNA_ORIENTATION=-
MAALVPMAAGACTAGCSGALAAVASAVGAPVAMGATVAAVGYGVWRRYHSKEGEEDHVDEPKPEVVKIHRRQLQIHGVKPGTKTTKAAMSDFLDLLLLSPAAPAALSGRTSFRIGVLARITAILSASFSVFSESVRQDR